MSKLLNWLVGGNAVATLFVIVALLFGGGHGTNAGATSAQPSTGVSHFNGIESDTGYFDLSTAVSSLLGQLDIGGSLVYTNVQSTSTVSTSMTLAASDVMNYNSVIATPNVNSLTYTLPASSTLSTFIPNAGNWTQQCWENATSTAGKTLTFAAGTGETLVGATTTLAIPPQMTGCLRYMRNGGTGSKANDISVFFD